MSYIIIVMCACVYTRVRVYGGDAAQFNADIEFDGVFFILYIRALCVRTQQARGDWRKNNKMCLEWGFSRSTHISYPTRLYIGIYSIICVSLYGINIYIYMSIIIVIIILWKMESETESAICQFA